MSVTLPDASATVVVAMTVNSVGGDYFYERGQHNPSAVGMYNVTYFGGPCYFLAGMQSRRCHC
jgi:hypothetical protein